MSEPLLFQTLLYLWFALAAIVFVALFFITAPYGRHAADSRLPKINATFGWVFMESPSVLVFAACFLLSNRPITAPLIAFLALWELHYVNRSWIFPFMRRGGVKSMPIPVALGAFFFTSVNGYLNGRYLNQFAPVYPTAWLWDPRFLIGATLFFSGFFINQQSDRILFNLRKPGETGYKIPRGGLYRFVSCPNYLGEIIEWSGFALATWSPAGLAFVAWTIANLAPRAWSHHRWYLGKFADYPRERRALVPLLF